MDDKYMEIVHICTVIVLCVHGSKVVVSGEALISNPAGPRSAVENGQLVLSQDRVLTPGELHPLRIYWEYLSYLFRKPPPPDASQLLEVSYRDYLQVHSSRRLCHSTLTANCS